ncbi:30S ribosomal protein S5 [Candidatus Calescamantes bacterium]|nr:30S ribosomal protein S5 [bacterium]MCK5223782.1 30S ribosomal protein S5 [Candidatus Calescamantes bacterium]MCK5399783.1 30S ribosomal protein S5 [bacterium]
MAFYREEVKEYEEKIIKINRVAKVLKGGRKFSFNCLMAVGDVNGKVGLGFGKANETTDAMRKAANDGKRYMIQIPVNDEGTIPFEMIGQWGNARVLLKPGRPGTGIIAGGSVRAILEVSGMKNIVTKALTSGSQTNIARATMDALKKISNVYKKWQVRQTFKQMENNNEKGKG